MRISLLPALWLFIGLGCSSSNDSTSAVPSDSNATGGSSGNSTTTATKASGGTVGTGASSSTLANGGSSNIAATGGAGGSSSTGGTVTSGGSSNTAVTGGKAAVGGAASGGSSNSGGTAEVGGSSGIGGTATSGGSSNIAVTGGTAAVGGAGGSSSTGGSSVAGSSAADVIAAGVRWVGRVDVSNQAEPAFSYSETGFVASFTGTGATVQLTNGGDLYYTAIVDGTNVKAMIHGANGNVTVTAASGLSAGAHTLEFYRQTESSQGISTFKGITVTGGTLDTPPKGPGRLIEIIGDSISCGYGDLCTSNNAGFQTSQESAYDSWGAVAARSLGADVSIVAKSGIGIYQDNTGSKTNTMPNVYGQTHYSPATPAWGFNPKPQAVAINLGTNDFAQNNPGQTNYEGAMLSLVRTVRAKYPDAYIFLTIGPMISDSYPSGINAYTNCTNYLKHVVTQSNDAKVSYFDLEQQTSTDYGCDYHPNVGRQKIMGDAAAKVIKAKLSW